MLLLIETQEFETGNCDKCVIIESCPYAYDGDKCMIKKSFPDGMSNGDLIKAIFPDGKSKGVCSDGILFEFNNEGVTHYFNLDWWNSIYLAKEVR